MTEAKNKNWQDEYILLLEGKYICWDQKGNFIALRYSRDDARQAVTEYVEKHYPKKK